MSDALWYCCRQRAGPLVKECRSIRPRLCRHDSPYERQQKNQILLPKGDSSVCRSRVDRLELRLALFGFEGSFYTLTFDDEHLPARFQDVRKVWRSFLRKLDLWNPNWSRDYIYLIEGRHGDRRYHIHLVVRDSDFSPTEIRHLWGRGWVDDEPVLRGRQDSYRRLAKYMNKEATDGIKIPIGARVWVCSKNLLQQLPEPEIFRAKSGVIRIPKDARAKGTYQTQNEFGAYRYGWYIKDQKRPPALPQQVSCFDDL